MEDEPAGDRSPEQARAVMTAIQRGWQRGRSVSESPSAESEPGPGPAVTSEPADGAPAESENGGEEWQGDGSQE